MYGHVMHNCFMQLMARYFPQFLSISLSFVIWIESRRRVVGWQMNDHSSSEPKKRRQHNNNSMIWNITRNSAVGYPHAFLHFIACSCRQARENKKKCKKIKFISHRNVKVIFNYFFILSPSSFFCFSSTIKIITL